jgi:hypothetical protein
LILKEYLHFGQTLLIHSENYPFSFLCSSTTINLYPYE